MAFFNARHRLQFHVPSTKWKIVHKIDYNYSMECFLLFPVFSNLPSCSAVLSRFRSCGAVRGNRFSPSKPRQLPSEQLPRCGLAAATKLGRVRLATKPVGSLGWRWSNQVRSKRSLWIQCMYQIDASTAHFCACLRNASAAPRSKRPC